MSYAVIQLISNIIQIYTMIVFAWVAMHWLANFGIVNMRNPTVRSIYGFLVALVEPVMAPIRKIMPPMGGLDLSPMVLMLALFFAQNVLASFARTGSIF